MWRTRKSKEVWGFNWVLAGVKLVARSQNTKKGPAPSPPALSRFGPNIYSALLRYLTRLLLFGPKATFEVQQAGGGPVNNGPAIRINHRFNGYTVGRNSGISSVSCKPANLGPVIVFSTTLKAGFTGVLAWTPDCFTRVFPVMGNWLHLTRRRPAEDGIN